MVQSFHNLRVRENHYFKNIVRPISIYFQNLEALNKSKGTQSELEWGCCHQHQILSSIYL